MITHNKTPAGVAADSLTTTRAAAQNAGKILGGSPGGGAMPALTANLFLPEDLEDVSRTKKLAGSDLSALRAVADWIKTFVAKSHKDLGRTGPGIARHFGSPRSGLPTGASQTLSSS